MVMPRKVPVEFGVVFPYGAFAVGEVVQVRDYDRSTRETAVQANDPDSGLPMWSVDVVDADPEARKANRTISVKIPAAVQPVLPALTDGTPFRQVEFEKLLATAYVEQNGDFSRVAWSFRASGVHEPSQRTKTPAGQAKSTSESAVA